MRYFLYISLVIFFIGLIYKISTWLSLKTTVDSENISTSKRISSALKGIVFTLFSVKILTIIKVFLLDCIFQKKLLKEDLFRWLIHILMFWSFSLLVLMHALDAFITSSIFPDYQSTINPFLFLRNLFGIFVIIGLCMALYRRFILKPPHLKTNAMDYYALILIAIIMASGILLEGSKIGSYSTYKEMVADYGDIEEKEEEYKALTAFWVKEFGTVAPDLREPFDADLLNTGREVHEMNCESCHSRARWAFGSYLVASISRGVALSLDRAGICTLLWYVHFLACFIGLAYLPFSKFFHIITSPLSLLANSVMDKRGSEPANIATRQALELDACTHCGQCTSRCSVGVIFEELGNINVLPSEKLQSLKHVVSGKKTDEKRLRLILDGIYLCTNCHRCTDVCPAGINLEDLWFNMREELLRKGCPEFSVLSPLSFYRGLMRETIPESNYKRPLDLAREAVAADCDLMKKQKKNMILTRPDREFQGGLALSDQVSTFQECFACQTCTNVCPVVANYENPMETLGMLPHQIMHTVGLGVREPAFGSNMIWDCVTCYQCQEQCPQGVKVTEVLFELKNLAIKKAYNLF